jgi:aminoglycoside phosphotransferase (APT) family kinase protein
VVAPDLPHLRAIARKYGVSAPDTMPEPWTGATGRVYPCGDAVIKVPLDRPDAIAAVTIDAAMNPVARGLGVRVPDLLSFDASGEILSQPYAVYRRVVDAVSLSSFAGDRHRVQVAWQSVGRDLALVHAVRHDASFPVSLREFRQSPEVDPRPWVDELRARCLLIEVDAAWLHALLDRIEPVALADRPLWLCHGDVNAANVMVDAVTGEYRALIDWAGAGWLDPVWDFAGVSLDVVPSLLAGHRSVAPLSDDDTAEARILWCQLQTRLYAALKGTDDPSAVPRMATHLAQVRAYAHSIGMSLSSSG